MLPYLEKKDLADMIQVKDLEMGRFLDNPGGPNLIMWILKKQKTFPAALRQREVMTEERIWGGTEWKGLGLLLMALKMEEQCFQKQEKARRQILPLSLQGGTRPCPLGFSPVRLCPIPDLQNSNRFALLYAIKYVAIYHSSNRKWIHVYLFH